MTTVGETSVPRAPAAVETRVRQAPPGARRRRLGRALLYVAAVVLALWILAPIYLITVTAFTPADAIYDFPRAVLPGAVSGETVSFFVGSTGVLSALWRSVVVAVISLVLSTLIGAPAGYALARYFFRGKGAFRLLVLATRAFPIVILSISLAVTFIGWGIYDSVWAVGLMHTALALPFTVLVTNSIFLSVPKEFEEAAQIYGATPLGAFVRAVLPQALPGLAAASIFTFVLSWNEVFAAVVLTLRERTLPALVLTTLTESSLPYRFASAWFLLVPSVVVIFLVRKYLFGLWQAR